MDMSAVATKALILAAGLGTRLRPLTDVLPKALVPLVGRPLLRHNIERLLQAGIHSIGVNTHHHGRRIREFAAAQHDCRLYISHEPAILGSAGGIGGFREFLGNEDFFVVCNADSVSDIDCGLFLPEFLHCAPLALMVLTDSPDSSNVCINSAREVVDLRDQLRPAGVAARLTYTGIAYMSREFLDLIPPGASELVPLLVDLIARKPGCVRAAVARGAAWRDIGTLASYLQAHREILLQRRPLIPEALMPEGTLYIGKHTTVDTDCVCEGFVSVGSNCSIGPGSRLRDCVIWDDTVVPEGSRLCSAVCGPGFTINV